MPQYNGGTPLRVELSQEFVFETGKSWNVKLFAEDINQSDIYHSVPYRDEQGNWLIEKLYYEKPEDTESGFYEMDYGYELREEGCFNTTLNSYSLLYNDIGNFLPYCYKEIGSSYDEVPIFSDAINLNNSDNVGSYNGETDVFVSLRSYNSAYDRYAGYDPGLEVKSISINNEIYDWNDLCCVGEFNIREIDFASDDDSLILDIATDVEVIDTDKNLRVAWWLSGFRKDGDSSRYLILDENPSINLGNLFYPQYNYRTQGQFCMTTPENEDNYGCGNIDNYSVNIVYRPNIQEKPAESLNLHANGIPWGEYISENVVSAGDTIEFSAQPSDPNGLENEISWTFIGGKFTETGWLSESETVTYTFTQDDVKLDFRVDATLRNNDGVGKEWTNRDGEEEGVFEVDNWFRTQFQVGE